MLTEYDLKRMNPDCLIDDEADAEISRLRAELAESQAERLEQARLLGIGGSRELALMTQAARLMKERDGLMAQVAELQRELAATQAELEQEIDIDLMTGEVTTAAQPAPVAPCWGDAMPTKPIPAEFVEQSFAGAQAMTQDTKTIDALMPPGLPEPFDRLHTTDQVRTAIAAALAQTRTETYEATCRDYEALLEVQRATAAQELAADFEARKGAA
jgi:hypothetical protein